MLAESKRDDGYYDDVLCAHLVPVMAGQCKWTKAGDVALSTTLGSCLSVCAYDAHAGVGGMNHFLLPEGKTEEDAKFSNSFRYGSAAIENLLNALYQQGAAKNGLSIKIFGGAKVLNGISHDVGVKNINFTKKFFLRENLRIESQDIGGEAGRHVVFFPKSGKVLLRSLGDIKDIAFIKQSEEKLLGKLNEQKQDDDVELF